MALALIRNSCLFKSRKMGNAQGSPTESYSNRRSYQASGPCDIVAIVQSRKRDKFRELINGLVSSGGKVNATAEHGMTALHYAVLNKDELAVKVLIAFGASCNAMNDFKQTPLDIAMENRIEDLVPLLVSIGCKKGCALARNSSTSSSYYESRSASSSPETLDSPFDVSLNDISPVLEGLKRSKLVLAEELEDHLRSQLDLSASIRPEEAYVHLLQQKELQRFREDNGERCNTPYRQDVAPLPVEFSSRGGDRVLSLDGGGMRGIIQLEILAEIERLTGKRIVQLFDWIIGNSIGGIMALALVYKNMTVDQLRKFYFRIKDDVFGKKVGFGYNTKALEKILQDELGTDVKMNDCKYPRVLVTAVDKSNLPMNIHYFNNYFDDEYSTQPIWKVARYTSAAPIYFTELDGYVDGGVMANNPCDGGLTRIQSFYHAQQQRIRIGCIVSLGSGVFPLNPLGQASIIGGMGNLLRLLGDALGQSEAIAERCKISYEEQHIPFYRFSPPLEKPVEPTETNSRKLVDMMITARTYMHSGDYMLDRLIPLLLIPPSQSSRLSQ